MLRHSMLLLTWCCFVCGSCMRTSRATFAAQATTLLFFDDTATTDIYTLSLHDALPISRGSRRPASDWRAPAAARPASAAVARSEEHTSELQSHSDLVCRLLLEKKKKMAPLAHGLLVIASCGTHPAKNLDLRARGFQVVR